MKLLQEVSIHCTIARARTPQPLTRNPSPYCLAPPGHTQTSRPVTGADN